MHGHRARALQRKAIKELRKTSKWAARELRSLEAMQRSFIYDAREAARLEMCVDVLHSYNPERQLTRHRIPHVWGHAQITTPCQLCCWNLCLCLFGSVS